MSKRFTGKGVWPPPVYVAQFEGGETIRMSFWSPQGKPLDFNRGRNMCNAIIGDERDRNRRLAGVEYMDEYFLLGPYAPPATDMIHGEIEHGDEVIIDPHFAAAEWPREEPAKTNNDAVTRILTNISKLSAKQYAELVNRLCSLKQAA